MSDFEIVLADEPVSLLHDRALFRPRDATLFVADVHIGKAASFRANGVAVPAGTTSSTLDRLDAVLLRTAARRLVILGDFLHARSGRQPRTEARVAAWRASRPDLPVELIRGNHDRAAGDPDRSLNIIPLDAPVVDGAFTLRHHPGGAEQGFWLAGHVHPGVALVGHARQRLFLPCFSVSAFGAILPAFGDFTGLASIAPNPGDRVFALAGGSVIEVSATTRASP